MWTKRELVDEAFGELGLGRDFDIGPDARQSALRRMDAMLATWDGKGIRLGYALPSTADGSDLDDESGLPDTAHETVFLQLAIRLAPGYGKTLAPTSLATAKAGYDCLLADAARPVEMQPQNMLPRGAGTKSFRGYNSPFMPTPAEPILAGDEGPLTLS